MRATWHNPLLRACAFILLAPAVVGLLLRYTVRDGIGALAPVFYGLPPLVVLVLAALSLGLWLRARVRGWSLLSGLVAALALVTWIQTDYVIGRRPDGASSNLRIVFWNIARPAMGEDGFLGPLQEAGGDVTLIVESEAYGEDHHPFWQRHFPNCHVCLAGAGITLLSKYPISQVSMYAIGWDTCIVVYELAAPFGDLTVVAVDIESTVFHSRKHFIEQAYEIAGSQPAPVIVLGDFNTPHTSVHFSDFNRSFQNAFATCGNGLMTTWRSFLPVLALDQIWLSDGVVPVHVALRRTFHSDHAMVIADVAVGSDRSVGVNRSAEVTHE